MSTPTAVPSPQAGLYDGTDVPLILTFKAAAAPGDIDAATRSLGGTLAREIPALHMRVLRVPAAAKDVLLARAKSDTAVERASLAIRLQRAGTPNDPDFLQQWALPRIGWDQVYGATTIKGGALLAILDTGVDANHPDLAGRVEAGQSFVGGDPNVDPNGHGTAMAGIAAAPVNNRTGMAGVAWAGTSLSSVQVLDASGGGWDSDVVAGTLWAADHGASVILMAFSSPEYSAALADAVSYATTKGAIGVDPLSWTPEDWGRRAPDEESTCREADRLIRQSFERKRLN